MVKTFGSHYWNENCNHNSSQSYLHNVIDSADKHTNCEANVAFLSLILMLGTLWLGVTLYDFTRTPFLNKVKIKYNEKLGHKSKNKNLISPI